MTKYFKWIPTEDKEWFELEWNVIPKGAPQDFSYKDRDGRDFNKEPYLNKWGKNGCHSKSGNMGVFFGVNRMWSMLSNTMPHSLVEIDDKRIGFYYIETSNRGEENLKQTAYIHDICMPVVNMLAESEAEKIHSEFRFGIRGYHLTTHETFSNQNEQNLFLYLLSKCLKKNISFKEETRKRANFNNNYVVKFHKTVIDKINSGKLLEKGVLSD